VALKITIFWDITPCSPSMDYMVLYPRRWYSSVVLDAVSEGVKFGLSPQGNKQIGIL
jgi:hypothetical protein